MGRGWELDHFHVSGWLLLLFVIVYYSTISSYSKSYGNIIFIIIIIIFITITFVITIMIPTVIIIIIIIIVVDLV